MSLLPLIVAPRLRLFPVLATGVLLLAAFNLCFRLDAEIVREWDESLYATTAWEMQRSGDWIATTFRGALDYYNTKPPLNVWLIATSFNLLGVNLIALRMASVTAAWLTVAVLVWWVRKHIGEAIAILSGVVLATCFAFFYVHSGRSANTDAIFTLLIVLTVVTLWGARARRWCLLWLGPILAAVFLLRGMAILLPLAVIFVYEMVEFGFRRRHRWLPTVGAAALFLLPVGAWMWARWQLDELKFLERVFWYDFVARSVTTIERHPGSVFYYLDVLLKHQYDWLAAAVLAWMLFPVPWTKLPEFVRFRRGDTSPCTLLLIWAAVALVIPTLMRTKLAWYLHPFYPVFAIGVAWVLAHARSRAAELARGWRAGRAVALGMVLVLALGVAEGKLIWFSYHHRDLRSSSQGLLLAEREGLCGRSVFRNRWNRAEMFVIEAMVGATHRLAPDMADFLRDSRRGDYLMSSRESRNPALVLVRTVGRNHLYKRVD